MKKSNIIGAVIGMAFSVTAFVITLGFKKFKTVPVGPEFFPRWLAIGLFICSTVLLIQSLLVRPASDTPAPTLSLFDKGMQRLLVGIGIIIVYGLLWEPVGFIIVTPVVLFCMMFLLGLRNCRTMICFSLGTMVVVFCAFRYLLGIDMPMGVLEGLF